MQRSLPSERVHYSGLVSSKMVLDLLCYITVPIMLVFGANACLEGAELYGFSLFGFAGLVATSFFAYKFFGHWYVHRNFLTALFSIFYFYMLVSGGQEGTGLYWLYAYPLLVFSIVGLHIGTMLLTTMLTITLFILFVPQWMAFELDYTMTTRTRFAGSMIFVTLMAYTMERSRVSAAIAHTRVSQALEDLARTDELTGLLNRRGITERVETELKRSLRNGTEMSLVLCDVDHFKKINDRYGHDIGDDVLTCLADHLQATVRGSDSVGRWGGEEFVILLPNTSIEQAYALIERIRESVAAMMLDSGAYSIRTSMSCGIASTKFSSEFSGLIKAADISLYDAKSEGRNCTRPVMSQAS